MAKDASGYPCLLIEQPSSGSQAAPIRLENLQVSFGVPCTITEPGGKKEQDTFTIVRCSAADPDGSRYLGGAIAHSAVHQPRAMAAAWHHDPAEHFDFSAGPQRIEVKSSMNRQREHYFSLEQLTATGGSKIVVASVFAERVGGGVSLGKLFDDTRALLAEDPQLTTRFDSVFYNSLGSGWADVMDECFDWELAQDSLAFFNAELVPKIESGIPPAVSDVRLRSDLSGQIPLEQSALRSLGGLLAAARQAEP